MITLVDLGRTAYLDALTLQRRLHAARVAGEVGDLLLLTEHERVLTLGRAADQRHLRVSAESLAARGIPLVATERGGDVTYHGPGQLVAYPILDLRAAGCGVRQYVRLLEETAIRLLARYGLDAGRQAGLPGVWVGERKVASVGVWVSRSVTMHGIAINLAPALEDFELIHPCGLVGVRMTSLADCRGTSPPVSSVVAEYGRIFADVFAIELSPAPRSTRETLPEQRPTSPPSPTRA